MDERASLPQNAVPEGAAERSPGLAALTERLRTAGMSFQWEERFLGSEVIIADFPNGREVRHAFIDEEGASRLLEHHFESVRFLGDYQAIVDTDTGVIEARVSARSGGTRSLTSLPGVEVFDETKPGAEPDEWLEEEGVSVSRDLPEDWRLRAAGESSAIELSPMSPLFRAVADLKTTRPTLKIDGAQTSTEAESLEVLESLSDAFFFELDVRYDRPVQLLRRPHRRLPFRTEVSSQPPQFPKIRYPSEPMSLYQYGRSAAGLPLLAFLAYYQVLEFFFPIFTREETIRQLQLALRDPRFDPNDDIALGKIVNLVGPRARSMVSEREQMRATIRRCFSEVEIRAFIESKSRITEHFCSKKQIVKGVKPIDLNAGGTDLRDQLADRIYAIRCRIVHTKQDGGEAGVDLLLPTSREARSLDIDVEMVRRAAQLALIAGAVPVA